MVSPRYSVADKIRAAVPEGVTVYSSGDDVIATPAVVIWPASPYMVPTTMSANPNEQSVQMFFNIYCITNRGDVKSATDELEKMRAYVCSGIMDAQELPSGRWTSFGQFGLVNVAGQQYAAGIIDAVFLTQTDIGE